MEIVEFETAKLAKEAGFDWPCNDVYYLKDKKEIRLHTLFYYDELHRNNEEELIVSLSRGNQKVICSAPEQSQLQKWLRDKNVIVYIVPIKPHSDYNGDLRYVVNIYYRKHEKESWASFAGIYMKAYSKFKTYEEALEKGLQKGLEILKNAINKDNN